MGEVKQMRAVTVVAEFETDNPDLPQTLVDRVGEHGNVEYHHPSGQVTIRLDATGEGKATEQAREQLDRLAEIAPELHGPYALSIRVEELIAHAGAWYRPGEQFHIPPSA